MTPPVDSTVVRRSGPRWELRLNRDAKGRLTLRRWYLNEEGYWLPTRWGMRLTRAELVAVAAAVGRLKPKRGRK